MCHSFDRAQKWLATSILSSFPFVKLNLLDKWCSIMQDLKFEKQSVEKCCSFFSVDDSEN